MRHALTLALLLVPTLAFASPKDDFDNARQLFRNKNYNSARPVLKDLLFPTEKLSAPDQLAEAYTMLGACQLEDHQPQDAKQQFEKALQIDPDIQIDPEFFSSSAVRSFDDVKHDLDEQAKRDAEERANRERQETLRQKVAKLHAFKVTNPYLVYVPFGIGQFNNGDYGKGGAFLAGEVLTLGSSFGIWFYLVNKYGLQSMSVQSVDANTVLWLQRTEIATGGIFIGLAILGMVEARLNYKPLVVVPGSEQLLKELDPQPPKPVKTTFHLLPLAVPNGAGIGLSWETP